MSSSINYEQIAEEIFKEQNKLRKNPKIYIQKLEKSLNFYQNNILSKENEIPIPTYEGINAVKNAINFLRNQEAVQELIYSKEMSLSCKDLVNDIGPKGLVTHEGTEIKNIYNRLEKYCDWDGVIAENLDFGFKIPENIIMNMIIDDGDENRYQRKNLFYPDFKYVGIGVGPHRDYGICVVIEYAYNIREKGTQYIDVDEFIRKNVKLNFENENSENDNEDDNIKKINNPFQDGEPDAPDNTISLKVEKEEKEVDGTIMKITKKIFTLDDDSKHIVEIEEPQEQ
jgi:uncharacterized protein YkwD